MSATHHPPSVSAHPPAASIVIIGAGPAAVMLLERILPNHARDTPLQRLQIQLVDTYEPGGGRIWRRAQSPLLKLNSMFEDVAFFTDPSCEIEGPVAPGPTLSEWVELVRAGSIELPEWADETLLAEIAAASPKDFPTRRINNAYLGWAYDEILQRAAPTVSVQWVQDLAVTVNEGGHERDARHIVRLTSGTELFADAVIYALGHNGSMPSNEAMKLGSFADHHRLGYVAPGFTADLNLDWVPAAEPVIVRGMGLAAIDLTVLLTEGRGGRFTRAADGTLSYTPSGREPQLYLGSRRGVPYRSKISSTLQGDPVELEFFGPEFRTSLAALDRPLDYQSDVWPRIAADLVLGYYRELFTAHPDRVGGSWASFARELRPILREPGGHESAALVALITAHVPSPADRFDLADFDRPLAQHGAVDLGPDDANVDPDHAPTAASLAIESDLVGDAARMQRRVQQHIAQDLRVSTTPDHSASQALFLTTLYAYMALAELPSERWNAHSRTVGIPSQWQGFFSYLASGPPGHRLEELLALSEAGIVQFLGGDIELKLVEDEAAAVHRTHRLYEASELGHGRFVASGSAHIAGENVRTRVVAKTLIDAWPPRALAAESDNPLLRQLIRSGQARELCVEDASHVGTTGQIEVLGAGALPGQDRQFALGTFTSSVSGGAFTRPGFNALPFRKHDRLARAVLAAVGTAAPGVHGAASSPATAPWAMASAG